MEAAGVPAGGLRAYLGPLEEHDAGPGSSEVVGGGTTGDAATDHGDVEAVTWARGGGWPGWAAVDSGIPARYTKPQIGRRGQPGGRSATGLAEGAGMTASFHGAYTVCVTPFSEDGSRIDTGAFRRFLSWQLEAGVPGVIVLGTTGEFLTVSDEERAELVDTAVRHVAGRVPVLVGTMNAYTRPRRCLQPSGRGARGGRSDDPAAVLLHARPTTRSSVITGPSAPPSTCR